MYKMVKFGWGGGSMLLIIHTAQPRQVTGYERGAVWLRRRGQSSD